MKMETNRHWVYRVEYEMVFVEKGDDPNTVGKWWGFPCDEAGNLLALEGPAFENCKVCIQGWREGGKDRYIREYDTSYWEPGRGDCDKCGEEVIIDDGFTNSCDNCDADYNGNGLLLAPRSQWGEETGETYSDIMIGMYNNVDRYGNREDW